VLDFFLKSPDKLLIKRNNFLCKILNIVNRLITYELRWQAKLESAALRLGLIGNICLAFLFLPVARGSSLLPAMGLTSESSIKYHIWLGHMVMALFTVHGLCYIIYWASMHEISQVLFLFFVLSKILKRYVYYMWPKIVH